MGCGFLESVYQECLEIEFEYCKIPFVTQQEIALRYRDKPLKSKFKPDFLCFDAIILELKATSALIDEHRGQLLNYLHATEQKVGYLLNFGHYPKMEFERFIL
jgi:GxxExxY protein